MPGGGQIGNKNAEKWTEDEALKLIDKLFDWLFDKDNYYENIHFEKFLFIEEQLGRNIINYLCNKFESFREAIKRAKEIQEIKISEGSLNQKLQASSSIFHLKTRFGYIENSVKKDYDFERIDEINSVSHFLTKSTDITNVYLRNIEAIHKGYRIISNKGSSRSSKTRSLIDIFLDYLFTGYMGDRKIYGNVAVFQKSLPYLKKNLLEDILEVIEFRNIIIDEDIEWNKTECSFSRDGRKWFYGSLNNESEIAKVKGLGLGAIWFNEAHDILYSAFKQLNMRAKDGAIFFLDHNPEVEGWVKEEIEERRTELIADVAVIHSTYKDNRFLPESTVKEIENFELTDPDWYRIYGLGLYGSLKGLIYEYEEYERLPRAKYITVYGQDFGFTNSKDAVIQVNFRVNTNEVYLKTKLYENGLLPHELTSKVQEITQGEIIFSDNEDARMIADQRNSGINSLKPKKGVQRSIQLSRCFKIFVHIEDVELQKEFKSYRYQKDPNNDSRYLNIPMKGHNIDEHLINAYQYAIIGAVDTCMIPMPKNFKEKK